MAVRVRGPGFDCPVRGCGYNCEQPDWCLRMCGDRDRGRTGLIIITKYHIVDPVGMHLYSLAEM